ncbi:MAG: hypothetical protein WC700_14525 [Gemmatimonadaceae bacterium]
MTLRTTHVGRELVHVEAPGNVTVDFEAPELRLSWPTRLGRMTAKRGADVLEGRNDALLWRLSLRPTSDAVALVIGPR